MSPFKQNSKHEAAELLMPSRRIPPNGQFLLLSSMVTGTSPSSLTDIRLGRERFSI